MGISMAVLAVGDQELLRWRAERGELERLLRGVGPGGLVGACLLFEQWRRLDDLLTDGEASAGLPLCALTRGEVEYPGAPESAHAILSGTTAALAAALESFTRERLGRYVERGRLRAEAAGPRAAPAVRWAATHSGAEQTAAELWTFLSSLCRYVARAAADGRGLLFVRYEDW